MSTNRRVAVLATAATLVTLSAMFARAASASRFVAVVGAGPSNPNLMINSCGDVFTSPDGACGWTTCARIPGEDFVSLARNASGSFYALTASGTVAINNDPQNRCDVWSPCGQIFSACPRYVAIVGAGPSNENVALSECGDVFVAQEGTCIWGYCTHIPADAEDFVSLARNASGNFYALTRSGQIWRSGTPTNDCHVWIACGQLPPGGAPYASIVGAGPSNSNLAVNEAGDLFAAPDGSCEWSSCTTIPGGGASPFVSLARNASGNFYALTAFGRMALNVSPINDCSAWSDCGQFEGGCTTASVVAAHDGSALSISPNPGRDRVMIEFAQPTGQPIDLAIYDLAGRRIATVFRGWAPAGSRSVSWTVPPEAGPARGTGMYFVKLSRPNGTEFGSWIVVR